MILYGSSFSPYVRKTLAYAAEKGIELEVKPVGLGDPNPAFVEASPFRKMPALRDGDFTICDSTAIITYLEAKYPEPPLLPAEPKSRARTIWYEEFADTILVACAGKMFFNRFVSPRFLGRPGDDVLADKAETEELPPILDYIEGILPDSGFLVDDRLTLADIAVAGPFVNLEHVGFRSDPARTPRLTAYVEAILSRPSFAPIIAVEKAVAGR
jgi:glutathione S-transferase